MKTNFEKNTLSFILQDGSSFQGKVETNVSYINIINVR